MKVSILVLFQTLAGKTLFFILEYYIGCGFVINSFYYVGICSLCTDFGKSFYHQWILNFIECFFCIFWDDHAGVSFLGDRVSMSSAYRLDMALWWLVPKKTFKNKIFFFLFGGEIYFPLPLFGNHQIKWSITFLSFLKFFKSQLTI